jgi:ferredoxin-type protein NapH
VVLGIDAFVRGETTATQAALSIILRGMLPALLLVGGFMTVAYRYGRLYCGWLCPHFSLVETLNDLLHRATGKLSLWDKHTTPRGGRQPQRRWWPLFVLSLRLLRLFVGHHAADLPAAAGADMGQPVAGHAHAQPGALHRHRQPGLHAEFLLARHLFCRFGCAVGLFQSLAWMANPKGLVISFDRERARDCRSCSTDLAQAAPPATTPARCA